MGEVGWDVPVRRAVRVALAALAALAVFACGRTLNAPQERTLADRDRASQARIEPYPSNRRYPQDAEGRPFVILGFGNEGRNPPAVLAQLAGRITYQRVYAVSWDRSDDPSGYAYGRPWITVGGKCDMDTWNEIYWDNLVDYLENARAVGITVGLTLWDGHNDLPGGQFGDESIWNSGLNVQGVQWAYDASALAEFPDPSPTGSARERLVYYQRRWIDRLLQEIAPFPNVIVELDNETDQASTSWWLWWAAHVLGAYPGVIATTWNSSFTIPDAVFASDARLHMKSYHDRNDAVITTQKLAWNKIIVADADNACTNLAAGTARRLAWRTLLRGGHWNDFVCIQTSFPDTQKVAQYGHLLAFLRDHEVFLWEMTPRHELVSNGLCMANVGERYLIHAEGGVTVDLTALPGTASWLWYDPRTGAVVENGQVEGGAPRHVEPPAGDDWVLWIMAGGTTGVDRPPGMERQPAGEGVRAVRGI